MRWIKRIAIGLGLTVFTAVAGAVVFVHTDMGRELIRQRVEAQLAKTFTGGATIGKLEGSPFGTLRLRDVAINGPDHKPAIRVATLTLRVRLLDLISSRVRVDELIADDVDIAVKRDARGGFQLARLLVPNEEPSRWNVDVRRLEVRDAHVMIEAGRASPVGETVDLDGIGLVAAATVERTGRLGAALRLSGTWRQRQQPFSLAVVANDAAELTTVPLLVAQVGDAVSLSGRGIAVEKRASGPPVASGVLDLSVRRADVARLVPSIDLPEDLAVTLVAAATGPDAVELALEGRVGRAPVQGRITADVAARRAFGHVSTGDLDLAKLTRGAIDVAGSAAIDFDATLGAAGDYPTATANIAARTSGAVTSRLEAELASGGREVRVERARVSAKARDLAKVSIGDVPLRGAIDAELLVRGRVLPEPDLAVSGTIEGARLRVRDASVEQLKIAIDAARLPTQPTGRARVRATRIARGEMLVPTLSVDAAQRADGRIAVDVRTQPARAAWLVELAALVTPPGGAASRERAGEAANPGRAGGVASGRAGEPANPGRAGGVASRDRAGEPANPGRAGGAASGEADTWTIDLGAHRVRTGGARTWAGSGGRIAVGPRRVMVHGVTSATRDGRLSLAGALAYRGPGAGDGTARVDVRGFQLEELGAGPTGAVSVRADVARRGDRISGTAEVTGTRVALQRGAEPFDVTAKIAAQPGTVTVDARAQNPWLGGAAIALDLAAPRDVANLAAWRARGREAIRKASLELREVDLARVAAFAGRDHLGARGVAGGRLELVGGEARGDVKLRGLWVPALGVVGAVDARLQLHSAPAADLLERPLGAGDRGVLYPTLDVMLPQVGAATVRAAVTLPPRPLDPASWQGAGIAALRGATVRTSEIAIEPSVLARFGIASGLRGTARANVTVAAGLASARVRLDLGQLRGTPLAKPVDATLDATLDGKSLSATGEVRAEGEPVALLAIEGNIPVTAEQLRRDPGSIRTAPLAVKLTSSTRSAPLLLELFGRSEIQRGSLAANVNVGGTIARPKLSARISGADLAVPPGPRGKPVKVLEKVTVAADWDGRGGKLTVEGIERDGRLSIAASGTTLADATAKITATRFDLAPLLAFAPGPAGAGAGTLDANLTVRGLDPRTAQVAGELHLVDARLPVAPQVGTLRDAKVDVVIGAKKIDIATKGKLGGGDLTLDGSIALDGTTPSGGTATIKLRKVSPIGAIEPSVNADVKATLSREGETWKADLVVANGHVTLAKTSGEKLAPAGAPPDLVLGRPVKVPAGSKGAPARPIIVATITVRDTQIEAEEIRALVRGKVTVTADTEAIGVVGSFETNRGTVDLFDRRYQVERAVVAFDGTTDPRLDIRILHDFADVTTITEVRGRMSRPRLALSSNPGIYSETQLLGFLLGGEPGGDPASASARDKITGTGASLVANQIGGYVKRALPFDVDVIRYEAASVRSSAAVTVGSWLTSKLFFAFRQHLDARPDENSSEGTLQYWLTLRTQIEGTIGDRGYNGVDILWRKRY